MGKITQPNVEIVPVTNSSGSGHQKQRTFKMPYMSDPSIVPRVQKYLESNAEKTYVDIDQIADELQSKYREYARRKRSAFRASVKKAYSIVLQSYGLEDKETSEDELLSDETEQESEGDGKYIDNNSMIDAYQSRAANKTLELGENELIDISSEDSEEEAAYNNKSNGAAGAPSTSQNKSVIVQGDTNEKPPQKVYEKHTSEYLPTERGKKRKLDVTIAPVKDQPALKRKKVTLANAGIRKSPYTFKNIGGMDNVLITITKFLIHMKNPEGHKKLGLQAPNALLLHGPSGCGKSLLAAAIAGELNIPLIKVNGTELIAGISGESEERIRELFERAYNWAPCVLFFDRIDSITPSRENTQREMAKRIVSQMLSCLDELHMSENGCQVCVIGATTRLEAIDPELRRQGRFDKEISLGIPDIKSREGILKVITKQTPLAADVDLTRVATFTPGYVAADLNLLIREASESALERLFAMMEKFNTKQAIMQKKAPNQTQENTEVKQKEQEVSTAEKDEEIIVDDDLSKPPQVSKGENTNEAIVVVDDGDESQSKELDTKEVPADTTSVQPETKFPEETTCVGIEDADIIVEEEPPLPQEPMPVDEIESGTLLEDLLTILKKSELYNEAILQNVNINMDDIEKAIKKIQPTTKKEGFATVPDTTWDDIGSLKDIREELQLSILAHIKYPERVKEFCLDVPCGILLCGPPGCGKTLLAKAIANEAGINFISVQGPELLKMYVGESERGVRTCFQRARDSAPCVIFFDEFDALCPSRSSSDGGSVTNRIVNQMLTEMSGIGNRDGVFLLAASNRPEMIDPAILRPGRLDKIIYVGLPTRDDRVEILQAITKNGTKPKLDDDVDLTNIASMEELSGYTGADLKGLVMQASRAALKEYVLTDKVRVVSNRHFIEAVKKMRPSVSEKDKKHYEKLRRLYTSVPHEEEVEEMEYS